MGKTEIRVTFEPVDDQMVAVIGCCRTVSGGWLFAASTFLLLPREDSWNRARARALVADQLRAAGPMASAGYVGSGTNAWDVPLDFDGQIIAAA